MEEILELSLLEVKYKVTIHTYYGYNNDKVYMLESLKILNTESSELEKNEYDEDINFTDKQLLKKIKKIKEKNERENYLKTYLANKDLLHYAESTIYLIRLVKKYNPSLALDFIYRIQNSTSIYEPTIYTLMSEVALEQNAYKRSLEYLECAVLLCSERDKAQKKQIDTLLNKTLSGLKKSTDDSSNDKFWQNKSVKFSTLLEYLYYQNGIKAAQLYAIKFLNYFPDKLDYYMTIYKILTREKNEEVLNQFESYLRKSKHLNDSLKNLYSGMISFNLNNFDKSIEYLNKVINNENNSLAKIYLCKCYIIQENKDSCLKTFQKIIPSPELEYLSLFFIACAFLEINIGKPEIKSNKDISLTMSKFIEQTLTLNKINLLEYLLTQFKKYDYNNLLPELNPYLAEVFIKHNNIPKAKLILSESSHIEKHRLNAWIHRLEGNKYLAEQELTIYRKKVIETTDILSNEKHPIYQLIPINIPDSLPHETNKIMDIVNDVYQQTSKIINDINLEYGTTSSTCLEYRCSECCTKTYPLITYTEYLYLKSWLDKQSEELKNTIRQRSIDFIKSYKEKYGKEPPFIVTDDPLKDMSQFYTKSLKFECPNLVDNKCSVYEARPFMCRAYGYTTSVGKISLRGCNFFRVQYKIASILNRVRKLINYSMGQKFFLDADKELIGESVLAPIPVWFAQNYEETVWKAKYARLSHSVFTPFFNFITKLYKKKLENKKREN